MNVYREKLKKELRIRMELQKWGYFVKKCKWKDYACKDCYDEKDGYRLFSFEYAPECWKEFPPIGAFYASLEDLEDVLRQLFVIHNPAPWEKSRPGDD